MIILSVLSRVYALLWNSYSKSRYFSIIKFVNTVVRSFGELTCLGEINTFECIVDNTDGNHYWTLGER